MNTIAYIANAFPSPAERYVIDEICELRKRGARVICCSGQRASACGLNAIEREFWEETQSIRPVLPSETIRALYHIVLARGTLQPLLEAAHKESSNSSQRVRMIAHTVLGSALANYLRPLGVGHIHAHHGYYSSWMAMIASRLLGIGFSFTLHGSDLLVHENLLGTKLRFCRLCLTVSNYNRDYILRKFPQVHPSKVLVQRLGVDPASRTSMPPGKAEQPTPVLLSVGRLRQVKNHELLIQACAALRDEGRAFQCWIAGDGPEYRNLNRMVRASRLQRQVCLLGQVPQARLFAIYPMADLVVLTSRSEGIPLVLMEAMAHGRLVLAPAITGIPELIQQGKNGFLYEPGSILDFLDSVRWILDRRFSLEEVRRSAVETISTHYDRQENARSFADHFLARLAEPSNDHEDPLLQQVQLSV